MAVSRADFMKFTKDEVFNFALKEGLLDEDDAKKLLVNKVNGYALLQCSMEQAIEWLGLLHAPATSLVGQLKERFPGKFLSFTVLPKYVLLMIACLGEYVRLP